MKLENLTPLFFNSSQQDYFFKVSDDLEDELDRLRHPCSKLAYCFNGAILSFMDDSLK